MIRFLIVCAVCLVGGPRHAALAQSEQELQAAFDNAATLVAEHYFRPPVRQQLLLEAARQLLADQHVESPRDLSERISQVQNAGNERAVLESILKLLPQDRSYELEGLRDSLLTGLATAVNGQGEFIPYSQFRIDTQLSENRYEGIGIQLAVAGGGFAIPKVFAEGPADRGGVRDRDLLIKVNGEWLEGKSLVEVVQMLRGLVGAEVSVTVRQPNSDELREVTMQRAVVPLRSVLNLAGDDNHDVAGFRFPAHPEYAYVRLAAIRGSTLPELQGILQKLERTGSQGLVIDLTGTQPGEPRHVAMLADLFLDQGVIGKLEQRRGTQVFEAHAGSLFAGKPLVVLIGPQTRGTVEWFAAALQDHERAKLVGTQTSGRALLTEVFALDNQAGGLRLWTGVLRRADGRLLTHEARDLNTILQTHSQFEATSGLQPDLETADITEPWKFLAD